ncbi:hypothetical protein IA539_18585 [Gordonia sp. zg691]|uniref:Uncharacterized protein n=1 Tax=Gordonia jinghuaiqii TaxID=2758710 RepID=A0A7D7RBA6_9ACTN|nr:hypothetical protein [Gordonia jinghuaiqii]MBD0863186.1 hypothetical protein [Gordonia jinghuaiqii]MCR5980302.1 hypothetical protein [Gordonia jinghuaiqii]QMT01950.1 hypothetical protein H1R19_01785 [Gordonia jinghuaiqii]
MTKFAMVTMYPTGEGSPFAEGKLGFDVTGIDCYALDDAALAPFDVLVFSSTVDQEHLARNRDVIRRFLDAGNVVVFGGHLHRDWLPGTRPFEPAMPQRRATYEVTEVADHPIFAGVTSLDMDTRRGVRGFFARGHHPVPEGAEVLVRLVGGQATTYIDRVSTAGTILVHATADLFAYSSGIEDSTAARIPAQLAQWACDEVDDLRATPRPAGNAPTEPWEKLPASPSTGTGSGVAAVYGGNAHHHRALTIEKYGEHVTGGLLYLPELADTDLRGYDALIIPERIHRGHLNAAAPRILEFLESGGTVIAFSGGEPLAEFLPGVHWAHRPTNYWWWLEDGADMGLRSPNPDHSFFERLELKDCTWHYHGVVEPPAGAQALVDLPTDETLLYVDEVSTPGTLVISTLDPMSHFGAYFMPATERFLDGFMPWVPEFASAQARKKRPLTTQESIR